MNVNGLKLKFKFKISWTFKNCLNKTEGK